MNIYILKINKKYLNNILKYKININKIVFKDSEPNKGGKKHGK